MDARVEPAPPKPLTHAEIRSIIFGIMLAMLLAALDQTIIATALPTIGRELGDLEHLPWVVTVYLLTTTAVTPLYGKISDSHGRRVTMLVAIVIFWPQSVTYWIDRGTGVDPSTVRIEVPLPDLPEDDAPPVFK